MFTNNLLKQRWMVLGLFALLAMNSIGIFQSDNIDTGIQSAYFSSKTSQLKKFDSSVKSKFKREKSSEEDSLELEVSDGVEKHTVTINFGLAEVKKGTDINKYQRGKLFSQDGGSTKSARSNDSDSDFWSELEVEGDLEEGIKSIDGPKKTEKKILSQRDRQFYTLDIEGLPDSECSECLINSIMGLDDSYDDDDYNEDQLSNVFAMIQKKNIDSIYDLKRL
ncbi:hypothetical protein N9W41_00495, partial [bacterium]|nr:hypothetical protein [bacterium]